MDPVQRDAERADKDTQQAPVTEQRIHSGGDRRPRGRCGGGCPAVAGRELRRQAEPLGRSEDEPDSRPLGDTARSMACIGTPGFAGYHRGGSPAGLCWVAGWRGRKKMRLGLGEPTFWRVRRTTSPNTEAGLHALEEGCCPWLVSLTPSWERARVRGPAPGESQGR